MRTLSVATTSRSHTTTVPMAPFTLKKPVTFSVTTLMKSAFDDDTNEEEFIAIESLSSSQIMELIEVSFVQACMGLSKGHVEPLQLFIVAVKVGMERYETVGELLKGLERLNQESTNSVAGRRSLDASEASLRAMWIQAIGLVLEAPFEGAKRSRDPSIEGEIRKTYGKVLDDLINLHLSGLGWNVDRFVAARKDILMPRDETKQSSNPLELLSTSAESADNDFVQVAVVTQTLKVMFQTIELLQSEASETEKGLKDDGEETPRNKKSKGGRGFGQ